MIKTKIPISKLSVGMLVTGMDRPWYATPFFSHRMTISSESDIETLKACGVRTVEVEVAEPPASGPAPVALPAAAHQAGKSESLPGAGPSPLPTLSPPVCASLSRSDRPAVQAPSQEVPPIPASNGGASSAQEDDTPSTPFEEEVRAAQVSYHQAKLAVQQAMDSAKMGHAFNTDAVCSAVESLTDSIMRNPHALASLSRLKSHDEYTYFHSVNTCVLAMALGRQLHMGRETLKQLGLGVLLHDVGKTQVPAELLSKAGRLDQDEAELIKQHVMRGVEYLANTLKLPESVVLPVLEHHERMDGSGYPHGRRRPELSEFGRIAGVVDVYDALTSDRPYRKSASPHQALQTLYDLARRGQLDSACVERFIRCMGIYPVGSCVKLSSGEIGVVSRINSSQTLNPVVLIVRESASGAVVSPHPLDLTLQSGKAIKRITEVLQPALVGVVPNEILDAAHFSSSPPHAVCR